jgi:transposase-like protein
VIRSYRWPKRHTNVVEEYQALNVHRICRQLDTCDAVILRAWRSASHPWLTLVSGPPESVTAPGSFTALRVPGAASRS